MFNINKINLRFNYLDVIRFYIEGFSIDYIVKKYCRFNNVCMDKSREEVENMIIYFLKHELKSRD